MVEGIFLAAGSGSRFGANKLLLDLGGRPLFSYALGNCLDSRIQLVHVVLGALREEMEEAIERLFPGERRMELVVNERYELGMMSSLKGGMRSLDPSCRGAVILLADMPLVTADIIDRLIDAFEEKDAITIPVCKGEQYHPRILPARLFPEFMALRDDEKGTGVLDVHHGEIVCVTVGEGVNYLDVDRAEELEKVRDIISRQ